MRLTVSHEQLKYLTSLRAGGHAGMSSLPPHEQLIELLNEGHSSYQFELSTEEFVSLYRSSLLVLPPLTPDVLHLLVDWQRSGIDLLFEKLS